MWIEKVGPSGYDARILKTRILKSFWSKHVCKRIRPKTLIQGGKCTFWDILYARIWWIHDYDFHVFGGSVSNSEFLTEPPKFRNFVSFDIHPPPPVQCWKHSRATAKMMISGCNFDHRTFQHWTGGRGSRIDDDECELFYVLISKCGHRNQNSGKFVSIFSSKKETIFLNIFIFYFKHVFSLHMHCQNESGNFVSAGMTATVECFHKLTHWAKTRSCTMRQINTCRLLWITRDICVIINTYALSVWIREFCTSKIWLHFIQKIFRV